MAKVKKMMGFQNVFAYHLYHLSPLQHVYLYTAHEVSQEVFQTFQKVFLNAKDISSCANCSQRCPTQM